MATFEHVYRCRCADWGANRILVYAASETAPVDRIQHWELQPGKLGVLSVVGLNPKCQSRLTHLRKSAYLQAVPTESVLVKQKKAKTITPTEKLDAVKLAASFMDHVFAGEFTADERAVGLHTLARVSGSLDALPATITGATHKLLDFRRLSGHDAFGSYFAAYRLVKGHGTPAVKRTPWKLSAMFSDRLSEATILRAIRTARANPRTEAANEVNWAGVNDNGQRIGGREVAAGLETGFPAFRESFVLPDEVKAAFDRLPV